MLSIPFIFINDHLSKEDKEILTPKRQTLYASGFDLVSALKDLYLPPKQSILINTGIALQIPHGFEGQIRSRSGLSLKHGIVVLNAPGTIDADYRDEIKVILYNHGQDVFHIVFGMRIAQLVIAPVMLSELCEVTSLNESQRQGGFGSTGY